MEQKEQRELMVNTQLIPRGIRDIGVLDAMRRIPRHLFVDDSLQHNAYSDMALPIGDGQTISQPYMVAVMTELLDLRRDNKVLEIGTGSGYQTVILSELSREVYTIERIASLLDNARQRFYSLKYTNIHTRTGDGTLGWPEEAPFDRIIITAASPGLPNPLMEQLSIDGILLVPVGTRYSQQLLKIRKTKDRIHEEYHTPCVFVPLIGEYGWKKEDLNSYY